MDKPVSSIWLIAETLDNQVREITLELSGLADYFRRWGHPDIRYLVPCSEVSSSIDEFMRGNIYPVELLIHPDLRFHQPQLVADFIKESIDRNGTSLFVMCDTIRGASSAAYAAAYAGAAFIQRVSGMDFNGSRITYHSHDEMSRTTRMVSSNVESAVITVLTGSFPEMCERSGVKSGNEPVVHRAEGTYPYHPVSVVRSTAGADLKNARVIIAAGRGIKSPDNLKLVADLAGVIPQSALAASRPVCDAGWMPLSSQVGMTGQTVRPDLYIACGISGSAQHLMGMKDSGCIVAINTDPDAPVFSVADYCVVEDLVEFLPAFLEAYRSLVPAGGK